MTSAPSAPSTVTRSAPGSAPVAVTGTARPLTSKRWPEPETLTASAPDVPWTTTLSAAPSRARPICSASTLAASTAVRPARGTRRLLPPRATASVSAPFLAGGGGPAPPRAPPPLRVPAAAAAPVVPPPATDRDLLELRALEPELRARAAADVDLERVAPAGAQRDLVGLLAALDRQRLAGDLRADAALGGGVRARGQRDREENQRER